MNGWTRALTTLLAAGAVGCLLWIAAQFDKTTTGGYWAAMGVVAGAGLLLGLASLRGTGGHPPAFFGLAFLPVFVAVGWILLYAQPHVVWGRSQIGSWTGDIGIRAAVHDIGTWNGVLAFGLGLVFAYALEPRMLGRRRRVVAEEPVHEAPVRRTPADEPTLAERREAAGERPLVDADETRVR